MIQRYGAVDVKRKGTGAVGVWSGGDGRPSGEVPR